MKWTYSKLTEPDLGFSLFRIQSIVNASFASGSLTAALLNIIAVAAFSAARRYLPLALNPCIGEACRG